MYSEQDIEKTWDAAYKRCREEFGQNYERGIATPNKETFINSLKHSPVYREPLFSGWQDEFYKEMDKYYPRSEHIPEIKDSVEEFQKILDKILQPLPSKP